MIRLGDRDKREEYRNGKERVNSEEYRNEKEQVFHLTSVSYESVREQYTNVLDNVTNNTVALIVRLLHQKKKNVS